MSTPKLLPVLLSLALALTACNLPIGQASAPPPAPVIATEAPADSPTSEPPAPIIDTPALSLEQALNCQYQLPDSSGNIQPYQLTDGALQNGADGSVPGFASIFVNRDVVALGDINGDGAGDAVVPIGIGYGGSGTFVYLAAVLNQGGMPTHIPATTYGLGDRNGVRSLNIVDGKIYAEVMMHGPNDPMCCPSVPTGMTLEYTDMGYRLLHVTTTAESGLVREITITEPAPETQTGSSVTLRGKTSVGPFENTLLYHVYDADGAAVVESSLMVSNTDMGQPSTFELPLDFAALGLHGRIRVDISEQSMADGSILMLDSLYLNVP